MDATTFPTNDHKVVRRKLLDKAQLQDLGERLATRKAELT